MSISKASGARAALLSAVLAAGFLPQGAKAQFFNRPPAAVPVQPAQGSVNDPAALMLRIERLENQLRSLTGQLEEARFQNRRLEEQVRRMQASGAAGGTPGVAEAPVGRGEPPLQPGASASAAPLPLPGSGRGDAFDPSQMPGAPGAPRVLGTLEGGANLSGPLGDPIIDEGPYGDPSAPLDLLNPRRPQAASAGGVITNAPPPVPAGAPGGRVQLPPPTDYLRTAPRAQTDPQVSPQVSPQTGVQTAMPVDPAPGAPASTLPPPGPREQLDAANLAMRSGDLERAEQGYKGFIGRYPTSRLAPEATFNLGDVYARRGRHREAAEQFLKVTTDFGKSGQAAASLHRLGQSLERLGAKEQACAAWAEVPRKYPTAPQTIRAAAERDLKRASC